MDTFNLGDKTHIFRCQLPSTADAPQVRMIYHGDIESDTGFVDVAHAPFKRVKAAGTQYALRQNDIVMVYNGIPERVGLCGLVCVCNEVAVTATSLCVIRPEGVDPVWLFYRLRSMRDKLCENGGWTNMQGRKSSLWFLKLEELRNVTVPEPTESEAERVRSIWEEIRKLTEKRKKLGKKIEAENGEINKILEEKRII